MTDAIVLREHLVDDFDSVLTLLTKEYGVLSAYARGARKPRSTLRVASELLSCSCFVLFLNKERYSVDKADVNRLFMGVRGDVEKLSLASYFCELTSEIGPHEENSQEYYRLFMNCLHLLDKEKRSCEQIKPIFEMRLLTMAGFMPNLVGCQECAIFEANPMYFLPLQSMLLCSNCLKKIPAERFSPLSKGVLAAMRYIIYADNEKLFDFTLSSIGLRALNEITSHYVTCQLDKRFATLDFYERICL